jgi:hypothetical protein
VGTVFGHGFHPLKARQPRSIPNLQSVHRQGRTPNPDYSTCRLNHFIARNVANPRYEVAPARHRD